MSETKKGKTLTKSVLRALLAMICFIGAQQLLGLVYEMLLLATVRDLPGEYLKATYTMGTLLITLVAAFPLFCAVMGVKLKDLKLLFKRAKGLTHLEDAAQYLTLSLGVASLPVIIRAFLMMNGRMDASVAIYLVLGFPLIAVLAAIVLVIIKRSKLFLMPTDIASSL